MKIAAAFAAALVLAQAGPERAFTLDQLRRAATQAGVTEPLEVLFAEKAWAGPEALLPLLSSDDLEIRRYAIRAIGRLEDPRLVPQLLALAGGPRAVSPGAVADAVAQSLQGFDPKNNPELVAAVAEWMQKQPFTEVVRPIGRVAYLLPAQVHGAEAVLVHAAAETAQDPRLLGTYRAAIRGLESLARLNARVTPFDDDTVSILVHSVLRRAGNDSDDAVRLNAFSALVSARAVSPDAEAAALADGSMEIRRAAVAVLGGTGGGLDDAGRIARIGDTLGDPSAMVRYEALRAYVRRGAQANGCAPIVDRLGDSDPHVVLAAFDALADLCKDDEDITTRIIAEAGTPPVSAWQRQSHAFVALAKRAPDRAALSMQAFATHPSPWVRMYAARAAAAAGNLLYLDKLAYDTNDNVREAALGPLRRLKKGDADTAIVAALDRSDVQLLRTAALLLKESPRNERLFRPLMTALQRLTKEGKETSRDARLPLLDAIAVHAKPDDALELLPLLKDFDPQIAARTADVETRLTGKTAVADPKPPPRGWLPAIMDLRQCVTVSLSSGPSFRMAMDPATAPVTVDRFLKLAAIDRYYDGLTIHRIVPNFVIQGGSPGANEYSGHKEYMRDEIAGRNLRGTVGLSTRGRNTADAQFFINLVDNARLDGDYTVFANVLPADMPVVDRIQEGDVMRLSMAKCPAGAR